MNAKSTARIVPAIAGMLLLSVTVAGDEGKLDWKVLTGAKISLDQGLAAAERQGKPISGKFEMEDGHLQLSIYTDKNGKLSEVIVDHMTGKVSKSEELKGEDLSAGKAQSESMAKAKTSLRSAAQKAVTANPGYRGVSVVPSVKDGKPVATVVLQNATDTKTVSENLD